MFFCGRSLPIKNSVLQVQPIPPYPDPPLQSFGDNKAHMQCDKRSVIQYRYILAKPSTARISKTLVFEVYLRGKIGGGGLLVGQWERQDCSIKVVHCTPEQMHNGFNFNFFRRALFSCLLEKECLLGHFFFFFVKCSPQFYAICQGSTKTSLARDSSYHPWASVV